MSPIMYHPVRHGQVFFYRFQKGHFLISPDQFCFSTRSNIAEWVFDSNLENAAGNFMHFERCSHGNLLRHVKTYAYRAYTDIASCVPLDVILSHSNNQRCIQLLFILRELYAIVARAHLLSNMIQEIFNK